MARRNTDIGGDLNIVKDRIRFYRKERNYTYEKLSNELMLCGIDINKQEIYKIEKGIRTVVDYELCGFMKVLDVSFSDLAGDYYRQLPDKSN